MYWNQNWLLNDALFMTNVNSSKITVILEHTILVHNCSVQLTHIDKVYITLISILLVLMSTDLITKLLPEVMILRNTELNYMTDQMSEWQKMIGMLSLSQNKWMEMIIIQFSYHSNVLQTTVIVEQVNLLKWVTPTLAWFLKVILMEKALEIDREILKFEDF